MDKRYPRTRVSKEFKDYLDHVKSETGLSKVQITKHLARDLKDSELKFLKQPRKRMGTKFGFKI